MIRAQYPYRKLTTYLQGNVDTGGSRSGRNSVPFRAKSREFFPDGRVLNFRRFSAENRRKTGGKSQKMSTERKTTRYQ